jgi:putative FmdB family regulatory protein
MPLYDYKCEECGTVSEFFVRGSEGSLTCPQCGAKRLVKQLSVPASIKMGNSNKGGTTCCGREERCDTPPCSETGSCTRG